MLAFLVLAVTLSVASAWDPHLKIAEKASIPHHIRHGFEYPYINIAQMVNGRQGFAQEPFQAARPQQSSGFRQPVLPPLQPGFQSQPFDSSIGFRNSPARQRSFFQRLAPGSRPDFGSSRSNTFFNRRLS